MSQRQLSFGEPVEFQGRTHIVVSAGERVAGETRVVDLAFFREVKDGAGKIKNVVGTAQQNELVGWLHDIPVEQIERTEDWFFTLSDEELAALLKERDRRNHEAAQAAQAAAAEEQKTQLLQGVKIKPSAAVLERARKLWEASIREEAHADEHDEVVLPAYEAQPQAWEPWIEQAKKSIEQEALAAEMQKQEPQRRVLTPGELKPIQ
jgi:hypothetical protein